MPTCLEQVNRGVVGLGQGLWEGNRFNNLTGAYIPACRAKFYAPTDKTEQFNLPSLSLRSAGWLLVLSNYCCHFFRCLEFAATGVSVCVCRLRDRSHPFPRSVQSAIFGSQT